MAKIILKQGEAKTLTLTVKDGSGAGVDLSGASLFLGVKKTKAEVAYTFSKDNDSFDKSRAGEGRVAVHLTAADTAQDEGTYIGELKCSWDGPPAVIDKSGDFYLQVKQALTQ